MKLSVLKGAGMAALLATAGVSILITQRSYAQSRGEDTALRSLVGSSKVSARDARFQPLAMVVMDEASDGASARGKRKVARRVFIKDWGRQWFNWRVWHVPGALVADGSTERPLTPGEVVMMEALFSQNLSRSSLTITAEGISGVVTEKEAGMKFETLAAQARAAAEQKAKFYSEGSRSVGGK